MARAFPSPRFRESLALVPRYVLGVSFASSLLTLQLAAAAAAACRRRCRALCRRRRAAAAARRRRRRFYIYHKLPIDRPTWRLYW